MVDTGMAPDLAALNDAVDKLRRSAGRTIPMFLVGILATVIAAGIAIYYIVSLSSDLHEARASLQQSQAALMEARANLASVNETLKRAGEATPSAEAGPIAVAIQDVARSQRDIASASSSISVAAEKLKPEADDRFETVKTNDGFISMRTQPSVTSEEITRVVSGTAVHCGEVRSNDGGYRWRWCSDDQGHNGFMSGRYLRKL